MASKAKKRARVTSVTVEMQVLGLDRRMAAPDVSKVLEEHFWHFADELTGLLTYGGVPVAKPEVRVTAVVVHES